MDTLAEALQLHRSGQLRAAGAAYRQVLAIEPEQPNALYLYGTLLLAEGDQAAEALLQHAVALRPHHTESRLALANARHHRGEIAGAMAAWRDVLAIEPDHVAASLNLAGRQRADGDWAASAATCRDVLQYRPTHATLWLALAASLLAGQCLDGALTAAEATLELEPELAEAWLIRGTVRARRRQFAGALEDLHRSLALDPTSARAHLHLGNALLDMDELDAAEAQLRRAVVLDPTLPEAHTSLGFLLSSRQRLDEAVACHDRAIALRPDFADARSNRAAALLLGGDFARGFAAYEARKHNKLFAACYWQSDRPEWAGEPLSGRTILVFCEQGFGDTIMCARYLPLLAARGAAIVLVCTPPLMPLLRLLPGVTAVVPRGDPRSLQRLASGAVVPSYDTWIDQMSLFRAFATTPDSIPAAAGYLRADRAATSRWNARLPGGRRVGLAWSGNPSHSNDHRRSAPLHTLAPLLAIPGITFVSLQLTETDAASAAGIHVIADCLTDFAETAAAIACLDLVIAVDTSVAHLAGALGVPTWLMLPYAAEWRWMIARIDSPWYAAMRLFRQQAPGAWAPLARDIAACLLGWREMSSAEPCAFNMAPSIPLG